MGKYLFADPERPTLEELKKMIKKNPNGTLDFHGHGNREIRELPDNLVVPGDLILKKCKKLTSLPKGMVARSIDLSETNITSLPADIVTYQGVNLFNCKKLVSLPDNLSIGSKLCLIDCSRLTTLPTGLPVNCDLQLRGCAGIRLLPQDLTQCAGIITDWGYSGLEELPDGFISRSDILRLDGCENLRKLPPNMVVYGNLDLSYSGIEELPDDLIVSGRVNLKGCKRLTKLPKNLTVKFLIE